MIKIALIDDDSTLLETFFNCFTTHPMIEVVSIANTVEVFEANVAANAPLSILFLDIALPNESGLDALPRLKERLPDTDIIMYTVHEDKESLLKAFCCGATGYILKGTPIEELENYISIVQKGGSAISAPMAQKLIETVCQDKKSLNILNEKEYQILALLAEGWSYKLIADKVDISVDGVRFYIKRIYRALNVNSKGEAVYKFFNQSK